jgi:hypothetical protein
MTDTSDKALLALADRLEQVWGYYPYAAAANTLRAIVAERQDKPAAGDVIETLARGLNQEYVLALTTSNVNTFAMARGFTERATAILDQIAPALRAEGMEMAAEVAGYNDWTGDDAAKAIRAEAKCLREGGEG